MTDDPPHPPPTVRLAGPGDADGLRQFRCAGRRPRYAETAQRLIRRSARIVAGDLQAPAGFRCYVFDTDGASELIAASAIMTAEPGIADWIVMGIALHHQSRRLADGRSLAIAVAEETARQAQQAGYTAMVAQVDRRHEKSIHVLDRLGFVRIEAIDVDCDLYACSL